MQSNQSVRAAAALCLCGALLGGCYKYAVAQRTPAPEYKILEVDPADAKSFRKWSFGWGLGNEDVIAPLECIDGKTDANGKCSVGAHDPCYGKPIARYETVVPVYSSLLTVVTLGLVSTVQVNFWCSNYSQAQSLPNPGGR